MDYSVAAKLKFPVLYQKFNYDYNLGNFYYLYYNEGHQNNKKGLARERAIILNKVIHKKMTQVEASIHLKIGDRQIRNLIEVYKLHGEKGLIHGLSGKKSNNRLNKEIEEKIKYVAGLKNLEGAKPIFVKEKLERDFDVNVSKETVRKIMIDENLWTKRIDKRKSTYRMRRPRKPYYGEMSQFDGNYHEWLILRPGEIQCLLLDVDDATGHIMHAKLCKNEGFEEVAKFWEERIMNHGAPRIIYTDGFSTYKPSVSPNAVKQGDTMPQFSRIMKWIGTETVVSGKNFNKVQKH